METKESPISARTRRVLYVANDGTTTNTVSVGGLVAFHSEARSKFPSSDPPKNGDPYLRPPFVLDFESQNLTKYLSFRYLTSVLKVGN